MAIFGVLVQGFLELVKARRWAEAEAVLQAWALANLQQHRPECRDAWPGPGTDWEPGSPMVWVGRSPTRLMYRLQTYTCMHVYLCK